MGETIRRGRTRGVPARGLYTTGGGRGGLSTGGIYMRYYGTSVQVDLY